MGSQSMVTVLGLIVLFSIFNNFLNDKERLCADNTYGYAKYTAARDIARSAIHLALKNMEVDGTFPFSGSLDGGTYTVTGVAIADTLRMTSTANFSDTVYTISTTMWRYPKPFPGVGAALGLNIDSVEFMMKGSALIDGRNYDSTGTTLVGSGDVAGVTTISSYDSATVAAFGSKINGSSDVTVDDSLADPALFVDEYIASADYRFDAIAGQPQTVFAGNQVWGTATSPKITFVNAGDSTNLLKFTGTIEGWGILVVKGNVQWSGTFEFHGLVVVYSDAVLDFEGMAAGTPQIIGSLLMGGPPHSEFEMRGTSEILYSSDAIDNAKYIGKLLAYRIVDWYE
ncbi:MAG TPA: hypothetical protein VFF29_01075 [Bacteroidota bacterium]|nr:hypothetical protein [Bacteroidota bacterium]